MATKVKGYVDTSALIAFTDRSDSYHPLFRQLFAEAPPLLTTTLVVAEGHGWFLKRYDRRRGLQFLAMIEEMPFLSVLPTGAKELGASFGLLRRFSDQDLTLVDALGLAVMKEHRITNCWSTDFHLGLMGASLVIHKR